MQKNTALITEKMGQQKYKYNGKELDLVHGLNTYDYGARQYNPVIPMWDRVDPLAHKYYNISPYIYCHSNPINSIDIYGMTDYYLYRNGLIKHGIYDDSTVDRLFTYRTNRNVLVHKGILNQLLHQKNSHNHSVIIGNTDEAFKLLADNSDVEWSLKAFKQMKGIIK